MYKPGSAVGAPCGNHNATKAKPWSDALRRAADQVIEEADSEGRFVTRTRLDRLADALLSECEKGEVSALKEFGDRYEGRIAQPIVGKDEDTPIQVSGIIQIAPQVSKEEWLEMHKVLVNLDAGGANV